MPFPRLRALRWIAVSTTTALAISAHATGLGPIELQSGLGQPLRASIPLLGMDAGNYGSRCISARIESLDHTSVITPVIGQVRAPGSTSIQLRTHRPVNEPALNILVSIGCHISIHRNYQILLDPVELLPAISPIQQPAVQAQQHKPILTTRLPEDWFTQAAASSGNHARKTSKPKPAHAMHHHARSKTRPKTRATQHSVLHLSPIDGSGEYRDTPLQLRRSDTLTLTSIAAAATPAAGDTKPAQAVGITPDTGLMKSTEALMKNLQAETQALRAETARIKQQNRSYQDALASRNESLNWIKGIGALLAAGIIAIAWLLWRVLAMKQSPSDPWHALVTQQNADTIDTSRLEENTGFDTAAFNAPEINTAEFNTTAPTQDMEFNTIAPAASEEKPVAELPAKPPVKYVHDGLTPYIFSNQVETPRTEPAHMIKAEEISDVMELVEAWMTLNAPEKVLELLKPFSEAEQPESPLPWLCLLDVYRSLGDREKYEAILERIKTIFNVKLASWDVPLHAEPPKTLADFPHVIDEIVIRWHGRGIVPYLQSLLHDDRDGTRHGFDLPVYRDIIQLIALAKESSQREPANRNMPEQAYALLFGPREEKQIITLPPRERAASPEPVAPKVQLRERPKYITPSYERAITQQGESTNQQQPAPTAVKPAPQDALQAVTTPVAGTPENIVPPPPAEAPPPRRSKAADAPAPQAALAEPADSTGSHDEMSPMAIKLHLALAYQDIGDKEGAAMLLDEVIHDGTPEQSAQARSMLARIA